MFQDSPIFSIFSLAIAAYLFYMWLGDYNFYVKNHSFRKGAFEGATPAPKGIIIFAIFAALALLGSHTATEVACGVVSEQTKVAPWAIFSWLGAAFVEELVFRGYLVIKGRGTTILIASIIAFSFLFAAGHPFIWNYEVPDGASIFSGVWKFDFSIQPIISTIAIFECSLLFYALRFAPQNPNRSLIPCVCAHAAYNCGVFLTKLAQGFVE